LNFTVSLLELNAALIKGTDGMGWSGSPPSGNKLRSAVHLFHRKQGGAKILTLGFL